MLALFAERLTWYYQGYPPKSVLKLTISLFLLWLCSVHHHLPVFVWLWLSLSLLHKSLKEKQSVNMQWAYSSFISGIKRLFISGGLLHCHTYMFFQFQFDWRVHFIPWNIHLNLNFFNSLCLQSRNASLYFWNIVKHIFLVYFAQKNKTEKFQIFNQNDGQDPVEKCQFFDFFNFLFIV